MRRRLRLSQPYRRSSCHIKHLRCSRLLSLVLSMQFAERKSKVNHSPKVSFPFLDPLDRANQFGQSERQGAQRCTTDSDEHDCIAYISLLFHPALVGRHGVLPARSVFFPLVLRELLTIDDPNTDNTEGSRGLLSALPLRQVNIQGFGCKVFRMGIDVKTMGSSIKQCPPVQDLPCVQLLLHRCGLLLAKRFMALPVAELAFRATVRRCLTASACGDRMTLLGCLPTHLTCFHISRFAALMLADK